MLDDDGDTKEWDKGKKGRLEYQTEKKTTKSRSVRENLIIMVNESIG